MKIQLLFVIMALTSQICVNKIQASETVGATIEITEDALNLFLMKQYNAMGIPNHISGNLEGITYDITLYLPSIRLLENQAKIYYGFKIISNIFTGEILFEDAISFFVPDINELTIKAISDSFKDKVNSLNIHSILKAVIINTWDSLQLEVYPMRLANKLENSEWINERSISVVEPYFSVSFGISQGKLSLKLNTYLEAKEYFLARLSYGNTQTLLMITTGCKTTIKEVYIYDLSGRQVAHRTNLGVCNKKDIFLMEILNYALPSQYYIVKVLYTTSNTFYVRSYKSFPGAAYTVPQDILN